MISFLATVGSTWSDPITRYRLTIEKPSMAAIVATCRKDFATASPLQLEWTNASHTPEDDVVVLLAE